MQNNGSMVVGVREVTEFRGYGDTISWWHDNDGEISVTVRTKMQYAPIKVTRAENVVNVTAYVNFTGDADKLMPSTVKQYITTPGTKTPYPNGYSYAEIAAAGIQSHWNGTYSVDGKKINLTTTVYSNNASPNSVIQKVPVGISSKQQYLNAEVKDKIGRANQNDGNVFSNINDYFVGDRYESGDQIYDNWSVTNPGKITLYTKTEYSNVKYDSKDPSTYKVYTQGELANVASHEFGHSLGLGDAYGEEDYRYAAPEYYNMNNGTTLYIPSNDKMRSSQGRVSDTDVTFVLRAWETNKFQPFPEISNYKFSPGSTVNQK